MSPEDANVIRDINEASFTLRDSSGKLPDVHHVTSPQGVDIPLTQPAGYKTPTVRKNLSDNFDKVPKPLFMH